MTQEAALKSIEKADVQQDDHAERANALYELLERGRKRACHGEGRATHAFWLRIRIIIITIIADGGPSWQGFLSFMDAVVWLEAPLAE